jgi:hypothetical protein
LAHDHNNALLSNLHFASPLLENTINFTIADVRCSYSQIKLVSGFSLRELVKTEGEGFFRMPQTACSEYFPSFQVHINYYV